MNLIRKMVGDCSNLLHIMLHAAIQECIENSHSIGNDRKQIRTYLSLNLFESDIITNLFTATISCFPVNTLVSFCMPFSVTYNMTVNRISYIFRWTKFSLTHESSDEFAILSFFKKMKE
jgi:hypothetical protein